MKSILAIAGLVIWSLSASAQDTLSLAGATCNEASVICTKNDLVVLSTENGTVSSSANRPSCFSGSRKQSVFIKFTVKKTGNLVFTIMPLKITTEYDWALYEFSGCGDNVSNPPGEMACNYVENQRPGFSKSTGMSETGSDVNDPFSPDTIVEAGNTYLLLIDNYHANDSGFYFRWGGTFEIEPQVDFTVNDLPWDTLTFCCAPLTVSFVNRSAWPGSPDWNVSNGQTAGTDAADILFDSAGTFRVRFSLQTVDGCIYIKEKAVIIEPQVLQTDLYIPTAFTPNGDLLNDEWQIRASGLLRFSLKVFNRWGELVFNSSDPSEAWDGKDAVHAQMLSPGIYIYHISFSRSDGLSGVRSGTVSLIR